MNWIEAISQIGLDGVNGERCSLLGCGPNDLAKVVENYKDWAAQNLRKKEWYEQALKAMNEAGVSIFSELPPDVLAELGKALL